MGLKTCLALLLFVCTATGCVASRSNDVGVSIYSPAPDPMIAHNTAVADIYSNAKRHATQSLLAMLTDRAVADSSLTPALALALFSLDARTYQQRFITSYPGDAIGVNADYGDTLAAAHLFRNGALHPIDLIAKFALHDREARARLLSALVVSRGALQQSYALAAGHALRTVPAGDAFTALANLPPPIRIAALSEVDWCGHRPNGLLDRAERGGTRSPADASIVSVQESIVRAVSHCRRSVPALRHTRS